jgi:hypothetical protein
VGRGCSNLNLNFIRPVTVVCLVRRPEWSSLSPSRAPASRAALVAGHESQFAAAGRPRRRSGPGGAAGPIHLNGRRPVASGLAGPLAGPSLSQVGRARRSSWRLGRASCPRRRLRRCASGPAAAACSDGRGDWQHTVPCPATAPWALAAGRAAVARMLVTLQE